LPGQNGNYELVEPVGTWLASSKSPHDLCVRFCSASLFGCVIAGSDDFGGAGYSFPSGGSSGGPSPATVMEPQLKKQLQQVTLGSW
jgi:hypothetical protein